MKKLSILLACAALVATASFSQAQPITLETSSATYIGFDNFENLIKNNLTTSDIAVGDQFQGVLITKSIGSFLNPAALSPQLATTDLYGTFSLTVTGGSVSTVPGGSGNLTFGMAPGDYIKLYTATAGTYASILGATGQTGTGAIAALNADGSLWAAVTGTGTSYTPGPGTPGYVQGVNVTGSNASTNYNWANLTVNNTGYAIAPELYFYDGITNTVQLYFQDILAINAPSTTGIPSSEFFYSSTDPAILQAVPEPGTFALVGFGLMGLGYFARRRNQK